VTKRFLRVRVCFVWISFAELAQNARLLRMDCFVLRPRNDDDGRDCFVVPPRNDDDETRNDERVRHREPVCGRQG
jgi:hypothetical protein